MFLIVLLIIGVALYMASTLRQDEREAEGQPKSEALFVPPMTYNQWARLNGVQQDPARPDYLP